MSWAVFDTLEQQYLKVTADEAVGVDKLDEATTFQTEQLSREGAHRVAVLWSSGDATISFKEIMYDLVIHKV